MKTVFKIDVDEAYAKLNALKHANDEKEVPFELYAKGKQNGYSDGLYDAIHAIIELISSEKTIMIEKDEEENKQ